MVHFPRYGSKIWMPWILPEKIGIGDDFYCGRSTKIGKTMGFPQKIICKWWVFHIFIDVLEGKPATLSENVAVSASQPGVAWCRQSHRRGEYPGVASKKMAENFNLWSWLMSVNRENDIPIWSYIMDLYYDPIWTIVSWAKLVWSPILAFRVLLGVYPHLPSFGDPCQSRWLNLRQSIAGCRLWVSEKPRFWS